MRTSEDTVGWPCKSYRETFVQWNCTAIKVLRKLRNSWELLLYGFLNLLSCNNLREQLLQEKCWEFHETWTCSTGFLAPRSRIGCSLRMCSKLRPDLTLCDVTGTEAPHKQAVCTGREGFTLSVCCTVQLTCELIPVKLLTLVVLLNLLFFSTISIEEDPKLGYFPWSLKTLNKEP